jgi:hypothetical protein
VVPGDPGLLCCLGENRLNGGVAWRNDRVRSDVITEAVEDVLIYANQTQLAGDNLVSVIGPEEDGVENRVDTPSRGPGEGPGSSQTDDGPDGDATPVGSAVGTPASGAGGQAFGADSAKPTEPAVTRPNPVITTDAPPPAAPTTGPSAPLYRPSGSASSSLMAPPAPTANGGSSAQSALSGAASGARGLAAKVGSSFSGLTKPKAKPKPKGPQVRRPGPGGSKSAPTRPQQSTKTQPGVQQTRSALLSLQRVEPMSVMKFSFLISLVGWVVLFVAVAILYYSLSKLGVFAKIEQTVGLVTYNKNHPGSNAASWFSAKRVLEYTALVCTINAILFTALATVGAVLYNLITALTGGVEVTLRESD